MHSEARTNAFGTVRLYIPHFQLQATSHGICNQDVRMHLEVVGDERLL